jgi:RNA polymerase sigma factor (sigma-70 family)
MSPGIPTRLLATQSDERLLALVREGHERAFEALVNRYRRPLLSYCRRLLPEARAEDVIQLALLKTWIAVREGAEVRDLKAWLYRVVHNTAANAVRDAAHDGEPLADPARRPAGDESALDLGLTTREALAEVAALPPLQREVIVRTAVAGHSHERVASDLGITHGAVRGLLYRARTTLRTAITVLTPPPLLSWMAGRADQGGPAPERVAELAGGGATVGFGGLLLKGGVVALTAGTVLTGAAVVHLSGSTHHRDRHGQSVASSSGGAVAAGSSSAQAGVGPEQDESVSAGSPSHRARRSGLGHRGASGAALQALGGGRSVGMNAPGGRRCCGRTDTPTQPRSGSGTGAPRSGGTVQSATPPSTSGQGSQGGGSGQSGGSGQGEGSSAGQTGEPVGSVASSGSGSGAGASGPPPQGSGEGSRVAPSGGQPGSGGAEGSSGSQGSSSGSEPSSGSESPSGSEPSGSSSEEQSGSLVGTVVHEVGNVLEHLLH